jgi:hypothetical protein
LPGKAPQKGGFIMATVITVMRRDILISRLAALADDWREAANGQSLAELKASVGLMLVDFASILELGPQEAEGLLKTKTKIQ